MIQRSFLSSRAAKSANIVSTNRNNLGYRNPAQSNQHINATDAKNFKACRSYKDRQTNATQAKQSTKQRTHRCNRCKEVRSLLQQGPCLSMQKRTLSFPVSKLNVK